MSVVSIDMEGKTSTFNFSIIWIFIQLILLCTAVHFFSIEADLGLTTFFPILAVVFVVHSAININYKPQFFLLSFIATLYIFLSISNATILLLIGLGIFGVCHLPIALRWRKLIVLGIAIVMGVIRFGVISTPLSSHALTVFAAIFMFRTFLYLYELKYEKEEVSFWHRINYFFLLPNIVLPLFPIVDYKTYLKNYYNQPAIKIYQRGINLILWSLVCLLIYRGIYYFLVPDIDSLKSASDVIQYVVTTYLTVIRLIGLLSLSVGILRLFGYNLPDIFNYMFFASSFADLFRRINIYWKNFLIKLCYYPVYFKLRKVTPTYAITLSTLVTFFFTWFFHIYQWAWILGTNPVRDTSLMYWGIFGLIATTNTLFERKNEKPQATLQYVFKHACKIVMTFTAMSILYSMWMSPSVYSWLGIVSIALVDTEFNWWELFGFVFLGVLAISLIYFAYLKNRGTVNSRYKNLPFDNLYGCAIVLLAFAAIALNNVEIKSKKVNRYVSGKALNNNDIDREYVGYYNEILKADIASNLWDDELNKKQKKREVFHEKENIEPSYNVMIHRMKPNSNMVYRGKQFSSNSISIRDKEYSKEKPNRTVRIALVGASPTFGFGVADNEVYEQIVENRLNKEFGNDSIKFEIINFAYSGVCIFHYIYLIENKILDYKPDYILNIEHCTSFLGFGRKLKRVLDAEYEVYPALAEFVSQHGITAESLKKKASKSELGYKIADWSYSYYKKICVENKITPIWGFFPGVNKDDFLEEYLKLIEEDNFDKIIMDDVFDEYDQNELQVAHDDKHPNAKGHQIIADRLYNELVNYLSLESKDN